MADFSQDIGTAHDIAEGKLAEQQLLEQASRLQAITNTSMDSYWVVNEAGNIIAANDVCCRMYGYSREELYTMSLRDFEVDEHTEAIQAHIQRIITTGYDRFETRHRRKDGLVFDVEVSTTFLPETRQFLAFVRDISAHREAEEALRESEWLLREAQRVSQLGTYVFDITSGIWKSSDILDQIFGIDATHPKDLNGWLQVIDPQFRQEMQEYVLVRVLNNHQPFDKEYKILRRSDGTSRWVYGRGALSFDGAGNVVRMIGTIQDITDRKAAEESLFKANRAYQALSACNELIAKATEETELLSTATRIVRHDCGFILAWIGIAEHDADRTVRPVAQAGFEDGYLSSINISWGDDAMGHGPTGTAIRTRQPCVFQDTLNDPDYAPWRERAISRGYRSSASFPIFLGDEVYGVLNVYADTPHAFVDKEVELLARLAENLAFGIASIRGKDARKRAEQAIQQLNRELDMRVVERTTQLEAAIREQESFSYSVSHDLRAPLRHINSFSSILMQDFAEALPPQARDFLGRIAVASSRMGELIDDLLHLSRVSRAEMARVKINLTEMAYAVAIVLQESDPSRTVEFSIAEGLAVQGDPTLLRLAMENLLGNSWKYTGKKSTARIELGMKVNDGQKVFFVRDDGAGFDMAYKNKLFGAFQRLHGAEFEGTGVGLATVQRIIHRHGGRIWAEGSIDQGATFYFTLQDDSRRHSP